MRRYLLAPCLVLTAACAPRIGGGSEALPTPATADVLLAGGPEGESPVPGANVNEVSRAPARPALASVAATPAARVAAAIGRLREKNLLIPVAGVAPSRIEDSFSAARDGGERTHRAVDILAPRNTPVLAADDGVILRMSSNSLGGITIYAADREQEFVYYYAHLDHYHDGVKAGQSIQKGDTLGYVGTTGNAPENIPHLHFQIMLWATDGKWWDGEPVNPYPVLREATPGETARVRFD